MRDPIVLVHGDERVRLEHAHRFAAGPGDRAVLRLITVTALRQVLRTELDIVGGVPMNGFTGRLDELQLYNRALTDAEIESVIVE